MSELQHRPFEIARASEHACERACVFFLQRMRLEFRTLSCVFMTIVLFQVHSICFVNVGCNERVNAALTNKCYRIVSTDRSCK